MPIYFDRPSADAAGHGQENCAFTSSLTRPAVYICAYICTAQRRSLLAGHLSGEANVDSEIHMHLLQGPDTAAASGGETPLHLRCCAPLWCEVTDVLWKRCSAPGKPLMFTRGLGRHLSAGHLPSRHDCLMIRCPGRQSPRGIFTVQDCVRPHGHVHTRPRIAGASPRRLWWMPAASALRAQWQVYTCGDRLRQSPALVSQPAMRLDPPRCTPIYEA